MCEVISIETMRDDFDWKEAFAYAGDAGSVGEPAVAHGGFTMDDVAEVIAAEEGENDEADWICAVRLKDGRFGFLQAGCDYTGWDCQAGGSACVAASLEQLVRFGLGDGERARLADQLRAHGMEVGNVEQ